MNDLLIVEDELGVREFLREVLEGAGLVVRVAVTGERAVAMARTAWPGAVLLDLTLPGRLDGWGVWDALAGLARGRPLRVIVFAGELDPAGRTAADARRAFAVVRKPVSGAALVEVVRRALS